MDFSTLPIEIYADYLEEQGVDVSKLRGFIELGYDTGCYPFSAANRLYGDFLSPMVFGYGRYFYNHGLIDLESGHGYFYEVDTTIVIDIYRAFENMYSSWCFDLYNDSHYRREHIGESNL